jgi:hypothetical protein
VAFSVVGQERIMPGPSLNGHQSLPDSADTRIGARWTGVAYVRVEMLRLSTLCAVEDVEASPPEFKVVSRHQLR